MTAPACATACGRPSPAAVICPACTRELSRALNTAANISADLDDAVARQLTRSIYGGRNTSPEPPLPYDVHASDAARALRNCLSGWVRVLAAGDENWPPNTMRGAAMWLAARPDRIRQHEAAGEAHRDITAAVRRAVAVTDRRPELHPAGACPCGRLLRAESGADTVLCACGILATGITARRTARAAAADLLGTPGELSAVLGGIGHRVAPSTISSWGTRGRIQKRPGGMYRLSEVLALAAQRHRPS